jgi:hypothetical protein
VNILSLLDKDGNVFQLTSGVWKHIQPFHPEINDINLIKQVLVEPDSIVKSNWDHHSRLYYKRIGKYFKVVVAHIKDKRIKTALTVDGIKRGEVIWQKPEKKRS